MPRTAIVFAGVPDRKERADLIAWLKEAGAGPTTTPPDLMDAL
jgi:cytochrome c2